MASFHVAMLLLFVGATMLSWGWTVSGDPLNPSQVPAIVAAINAAGGSATTSSVSNICNTINPIVNVSCTTAGYVNGLDWIRASGSIPAIVSVLTQMTRLVIVYSTFIARLPDGLSALTNVANLTIHDNSGLETSPLPFSSLLQLTYMRLDHNGFKGSIPAAVFKPLVSLQYIRLDYNSFSGTFPYDSFSAMNSLTYFGISDCWMTGPVPPFSLPNLMYLDLGDNFWTGTIPTALANNPNLANLDLAEDPFLVSSIPNAFSKLTALTYLYMGNNTLNGTLPTGLGGMTSLSNLMLDHNFLVGTLPITLSKLVHLTFLDLSYNALTGHIPNQVVQFLGFPFVGLPPIAFLQFNFFIGTAPALLTNATLLRKNCLARGSPSLWTRNNQRSAGECRSYCLTGVWDSYAVPCVGLGLCIPTVLNNNFTGSHFRCSNCQPYPYTSYYYYATCARYRVCTTLVSSSGGCTCPRGSVLTSSTCNPGSYQCCCPSSAPFGINTKDALGRVSLAYCTSKDPGA